MYYFKTSLPLLKHFYFIIFLSVLTALPSLGQSNAMVTGTLVDAQTGEALIGANVVLEGTTTGTSTNAYGYFTIPVPASSVRLRFSYTGYETHVQSVSVNAKVLNLGRLSLTPAHVQLKEAVVRATQDQLMSQISRTQMGLVDLPIQLLNKVPSLGGEADMIKALQLTPGIKRGGEGSVGMYVRGGNVDENLILLDEAPLYNVGHLFGFFSVFNSHALKDVQMYKAAFPSRYGGRLSSIMDVRMKEGNLQKFKAVGSLGIIASNLMIEGPIIKDKTSFLISGRRTYLDAVTGNLIPYHFYDINGKINHQIDNRNHLYFSFYKGDDVLNINQQEASSQGDVSVNSSLNLGNTSRTVRWNHIYKDSRFFSNVSLISTRFRYEIRGNEGVNSLLIKSSIKDLGGKADFQFQPNTTSTMTFGLALTSHQFSPNIISTTGDMLNVINAIDINHISNTEYAVYVNHEKQLSERWQLNYGLRASSLRVQGRMYLKPEPRISARYLLNEAQSLKASYARMVQYLHLVSSSSITLPTDLWYPATAHIKPGLSDQASIGFYQALPKQKISLSIEAYYKWLYNQIEYREGASLLLNDDYEKELVRGCGYSYGAEFFVKKTEGRLTGWLGYTLSYALRQFDDLNQGKPYYARFDRRHDFSLVSHYDLTRRKSIALNILYATGSPFTGQTSQYLAPGPALSAIDILPVYTNRNALRLSPAFRIDLDYTYRFDLWKRIKCESHLSIYNLLNRTQPARVNREVDNKTGKVIYQQKGLFGLIPAVSFNFSV